jgi:hypothetical protein
MKLLPYKLISIFKSILQPDTYLYLKKCDVLLVCHDHDLGLTLNHQAYSPIIDSMFELLETHSIRCQRFALPFSILVGKHAYHHPSSANRKILFLKIITKIISFFNLTSTKAPLEELFYSQLFTMLECKCIMGIGLNASMCNAAKKQGIVSIELLHGFGLPNIPEYIRKQYRDAPPQKIIAFDTLSSKTYTDFMDSSIIIQQMEPFWLNNVEDSSFVLPFNTQNYAKKILITLQWGYDHDHPSFENILDNGIISDALIKAIEHSQHEIFWSLRFHPIQLRNSRYQHHIQFIDNLIQKFSNCEWEKASSLPLPHLLEQCDGHISMISGSSYVAAFFGVPTLLLCPTLKKGQLHDDYFADLIASHKATLGNMVESDILKWAINTHPLKKHDSLVTNPISITELITSIMEEKRSF